MRRRWNRPFWRYKRPDSRFRRGRFGRRIEHRSCASGLRLRPALGFRKFLGAALENLRASMRRTRQRKFIPKPSSVNLPYVPLLARIRTWRTKHRSCGKCNTSACNTYIIIQIPRCPGRLASRRIAAALRKGLESHKRRNEPGEGRNGLYLMMTERVRLFCR